MTATTSIATLRELRRLFAQFGLPQIIVSDNGTQFTSVEFQDFCRNNGIKHVRSPPYHPQSNGQAERFVDTFKRSLAKMKNNGPTVDTNGLCRHSSSPTGTRHAPHRPLDDLPQKTSLVDASAVRWAC
ncbi:hypothetical protein TELCIR_25244 [Teladorsagia circumcincta]|uniref:Integrase catalytic domain-containing protein n=1 Tax=Teladorsagia circumcincta TaxID=45464 RepID=A0A2G9T639_TELCI|nr:hypothetical protein TELCIR_25244 [Teladorsagia circumcincta]